MNTPFHPFRPALQPLGHPLLPSAAPPGPGKPAPLSARQLLDAELGLFLLAQLRPTARPDALPDLLRRPDPITARPALTPRQTKYLSRGRLLLSQYQQPGLWQHLLHRYARHADPGHAYDLPTDLSWFRQKTVGFFRNRTTLFRRMLCQ